MSDNKINDTLLRLVKNLNPPNGSIELHNFEYNENTKRSLSCTSNDSQTSSLEEASPLKKIKREKTLELSYVGSPRETRRIRADLMEARNTILNLESRIQHMHNVRKEMQVMFDNETKSLKKQHEYDKKTIDQLETQLQSIRKREMDLKEKLAETTNRLNMVKVEKDEEIQELEKSLSEMKEESKLFDEEESTEIITLNRRIAELEIMLSSAEEDAEAQKNLVTVLQARLSEINSNEREMDKKDQALQAALLRIKELEYAKENFLESQQQAKVHFQLL